ncbi:MAG: cytidylate kinase-like family protein [Candidatus Zixiibacteriota bacterium]
MPVITITRGSLSASTKLTHRLAAELNCRSLSREDLIEYGKKYGIDEFLHSARKIMEAKPPNSWDPHAKQIQHYLTIAKAALLDFVVQGDIIYHGLQTHFILTDVPRVMKIKVVAPMDYRIKTLMEESEINENTAREHIKFVDEMRISWAKFLYGENFDDPTYYDMILNMSHLSLDAMAQIVTQMAHRPEFRLNAGTMKEIRDAHLRALVRAQLVRYPETREIEISVVADSVTGDVKVTCQDDSGKSTECKKRIEKALSEIELITTLKII